MNNIQHPTQTDTASSSPWTPRDVMLALVVAIGWILLLSITGNLLEYFGYAIDPSITIIFGTLLLLVPVWYFSIYKYGASWSQLGLRHFRPRAVGLGCGLMLLSLLFNAAYAAILATFGMRVQPDITPMFDATAFPLALLFGGAFVAPLVEEIFFRGFVFAGLRQRWSWQVAALLSALLFAVAHIVPTSFIPIFILGLIFAYLYHLSDSIWPAILMHMLTNSIALSAAYAISQGWIPQPPGLS